MVNILPSQKGSEQMLKMDLHRLPRKGSRKLNGRDSESKRLGVKRRRAVCSAGNILVRQRGTKTIPQQCWKRQTIHFIKIDGVVRFERKAGIKTG